MERCRTSSAAMNAVGWLALSMLLSVTTWCNVCAAMDPPSDQDRSPLRGEFSIGREGRWMTLPVTISNQTYRFLLDTGAGRSGFDTTFRETLGPPLGSELMKTAAGLSRVEAYAWPHAMLGDQVLKANLPVACIDFSELRRASNEQIYGVIGMDLLRNCYLQIDFDQGRLHFIDSIAPELKKHAAHVSLEYSREGVPLIAGDVGDGSVESFMIDTGAQGNSLQIETFDRLLSRKLIRVGGSYKSITAGGEVHGYRGYLQKITVGPLAHDGLRFSRLNMSSVGLRFLSRYVVSFDFPNSVAYFEKGQGFSKPEPQATSGMALNWVDGTVKIVSTVADGPAAKAGIRANDLLVSVDDKPISEFDYFSLRRLMTSRVGANVSVRVRRDDQEIRVKIALVDD